MPTPSVDSRVTPAMLHILLALASEDLHGYGIMQAIDERTDGSVEIGPGTLYRSLAHLSKTGLIEEQKRSAEKGRRTYSITEAGKAMAQTEASRLARLVSWAKQSGLLGRTT